MGQSATRLSPARAPCPSGKAQCGARALAGYDERGDAGSRLTFRRIRERGRRAGSNGNGKSHSKSAVKLSVLDEF
jgi:hypothetical protein